MPAGRKNDKRRERAEAASREVASIAAMLAEWLTQEQRRDVAEYLRAGEHGLALEILCDWLCEDGTAIPSAIVDRIADCGMKMGIDERYWRGLRVGPASEGR
jgi:hypothetical protein